MAAALRSETTTASDTAAHAAEDRQQWWEGVQLGFSALLTEAAHSAAPQRLAG